MGIRLEGLVKSLDDWVVRKYMARRRRKLRSRGIKIIYKRAMSRGMHIAGRVRYRRRGR